MKLASLDLGSNTFLCLVAEVEQQKISHIYSDTVEVVRLGEGLSKNKFFQPQALNRARQTLMRFRQILDREKPQAVLAMATSAARDAENQQELFNICSELNIPLEIIPGQKEAEITYAGAISGQSQIDQSASVVFKSGSRLIVDIGGGSTEFIFGLGERIQASQSLDIGCVRLTEKFIPQQPTSDDELQRLQDYVHHQIKDLLHLDFTAPHEILAVAGTPTTLAQVEIGRFDPALIDGYVLSEVSLKKWLLRLQGLTIPEKIQLGFPEGRADVILVGLVILLETLKIFNLNQIIVSTRGVRHGVILELARRHRH